jgi:transcription antitermination factor NusG
MTAGAVRWELTDEAYHLMKDTPRVMGFLGADDEPIPISDAAAMHILAETERSKASGGDLEVDGSGSRFVSLPQRNA